MKSEALEASDPTWTPASAELVRRELSRVRGHLRKVGYADGGVRAMGLYTALEQLFRLTDEPRLETLSMELLEAEHRQAPRGSSVRRAIYRLAHALHGMGLLPRPIPHRSYGHDATTAVDPAWASWCWRWYTTSTLASRSRRSVYYAALKTGRWLANAYPETRSPGDWTREIALGFVVAVSRMTVGELTAPSSQHLRPPGAPLSANYKQQLLAAMRVFLRDAQEWGWCEPRFDPIRVLRTPRSVRAQIGPKPRVIADEIWAKLLWAGLNLAASDLPTSSWYPLAMVRAVTMTWLFAGLRSDELVRLGVGCIRWQEGDAAPGAAASRPEIELPTCLLDVPTHKTGASYTKPVDSLVGEAIQAWEAERPAQPVLTDPKTGEQVRVLFCFRGRRLPSRYLNLTLIPALCRKAGVPPEDARGRITSHRARTTIATQLYNAKEPMTLFELQAWLGHRSPLSTQYYAKIMPTTLAKAYQDAGYFTRNLRTIEVLVDRNAIESGATAKGTPWQYYDLGHGYCTYSFFEQCPHRMACARCDFYLPKGSSRIQLLEATGNLQRMLAEVPLTDDERAAVEDGRVALEGLLERLADVPTPAGPTPRQLDRRLPVLTPSLPSQTSLSQSVRPRSAAASRRTGSSPSSTGCSTPSPRTPQPRANTTT